MTTEDDPDVRDAVALLDFGLALVNQRMLISQSMAPEVEGSHAVLLSAALQFALGIKVALAHPEWAAGVIRVVKVDPIGDEGIRAFLKELPVEVVS